MGASSFILSPHERSNAVIPSRPRLEESELHASAQCERRGTSDLPGQGLTWITELHASAQGGRRGTSECPVIDWTRDGGPLLSFFPLTSEASMSSRADRAREIRAACLCSRREARDPKSSWAGAHLGTREARDLRSSWGGAHRGTRELREYAFRGASTRLSLLCGEMK